MYEPLEMGLVSVDQCFLGSGSMVINHRGRQTGKNANTILKKKDGTSLIKSYPSKIDSKELSKSECPSIVQTSRLDPFVAGGCLKDFFSCNGLIAHR